MTPAAKTAIDLVLKHEGGLVDHPRDPGGLTNFGISLRAYPELGRDGIRNLTREQAAEIYERDYWQKIRGDELPLPVAVMVLDAAVNSGVRRSVQWLQRALRVADDGVIGPVTIGAAHEADVLDLLRELASNRIQFLMGLPTWDTFGNGWGRRIDDTLDFARSLA